MLDLRHLRHLRALAELGSFSRAADLLAITQPALSRSIQALEASVGAKLFDRQRGSIKPTDMGRLLLKHAQALDLEMEDLEREIRLAKGLDIGELRIGLGPFGAAALAGPVAGALSRQSPGLRMKLLIATPADLPDYVRAGELDLFVGNPYVVERLDDFFIERLSHHPLHLTARSGHPIFDMNSPWEHLFDFPIAAPWLPERFANALISLAPAKMRRALSRSGPITLQCTSAQMIVDVIAGSDAVALLPIFITRDLIATGRLSSVPPPPNAPTLRPTLAWLHRRSVSGPMAKFIAMIRAHDAAMAASAAKIPKENRRRATGGKRIRVR